MKQVILILFVVLSVQACQTKKDPDYKPYYQAENSEKFNDSLTLKEAGSFAIEVDSVTPLSFRSLNYLDYQGKEYLSYLNAAAKAVYITDLSSKKVLKKIPLAAKGRNNENIEFDKMAHYMQSPDSIFLSDSWESVVYLVNGDGKRIAVEEVRTPGGKYPKAGLTASTDKPLAFTNGRLYFSGHLINFEIEDQTKVSNAYYVDMKSHQVISTLFRPKLYNKATWAGDQFQQFSTINPIEGLMVYSFAADPFLHVLNLKSNKTFEAYAGSKYFKGIRPFGLPGLFTNENADIRKLEEYDYLIPQFDKIIYDQYRKLYYRFSLLPITKEQYALPSRNDLRQQSVVILDSRFKKLGEMMLPVGRFSKNMAFVSREGLNFAELPKLQPNDAQIKFITYKISTI